MHEKFPDQWPPSFNNVLFPIKENDLKFFEIFYLYKKMKLSCVIFDQMLFVYFFFIRHMVF